MKAPYRANVAAFVALSLLCLLPPGVAKIIERQAARPVPAPIKVSAKTLAKYTGAVPLGRIAYVRLGEQWEQEEHKEDEGVWSIYVSGPPRPIEAHPDTPQGWKVEFVEELPAWESSGAKTIGVRVTVPRGARQALITGGATAGMFHTRNGVQLYYSESFSIATHGQTSTPHHYSGRTRAGHERAHAAAPGR
jgi:hypothetical protein